MQKPILVWDFPTRIFHWALALSFAGAFLTADTERYRDLHVTLGYLMLGLVAFRLLWGFIGSRYARFSSFTFPLSATVDYLKSLLHGKPEHYVGHNPAGAIAIFLLLGLTLLTTACGILLYFEVGGEAFEDLHEGAANLMLAVVGIHIAGVVISSLLHRENLIRAMITGYKTGEPGQGIRRPFPFPGVIIAGLVASFLAMFQPAGPGTSPDGNASSTQHED